MKDLLAAVGSTLPAWSMARTSKPCAPSDSVSVVRGDVQAANGAVSTRHSKLAPASFAEKANVGVESFVVPVGPDSIDVCGGVRLAAADACQDWSSVSSVSSVVESFRKR